MPRRAEHRLQHGAGGILITQHVLDDLCCRGEFGLDRAQAPPCCRWDEAALRIVVPPSLFEDAPQAARNPKFWPSHDHTHTSAILTHSLAGFPVWNLGQALIP
jgi:hypothetical protein